MSLRPLRILVIYYHPESEPEMRAAIGDHLHLMEYSDVPHEITYFNAAGLAPFWDVRDIVRADPPDELQSEAFDVVLIHYTFLSGCIIGSTFYRWKRQFDWISRLDALRVAMPQDEGNCAEVLEEWLIDMDVHVVMSIHYRPDGRLYPALRHVARIERCLTGYINDAKAREVSHRLKPIAERHVDIVYRARRLPHWFGRSGRAKYTIADVVRAHSERNGLRIDVSTDSRDVILGSQWLEFIASSRAVIGTEGGYSAVDWRGEVKGRISQWVAEDPDLTFEEVDARMPSDWDDARLFTITPRHFEAITTKTAQILLEGDYRSVLQPGDHYLAIKSDFSNVDDVLERLHDHQGLQEMVDRAYADVYESGRFSYAAFCRELERVIDEELTSGYRNGETNVNQNMPESYELSVERALIAERHRNELLELRQAELVEKTQEHERVMTERIDQTITRLTAQTSRSTKVLMACMIGCVILSGMTLVAVIVLLMRSA